MFAELLMENHAHIDYDLFMLIIVFWVFSWINSQNINTDLPVSDYVTCLILLKAIITYHLSLVAKKFEVVSMVRRLTFSIRTSWTFSRIAFNGPYGV